MTFSGACVLRGIRPGPPVGHAHLVPGGIGSCRPGLPHPVTQPVCSPGITGGVQRAPPVAHVVGADSSSISMSSVTRIHTLLV